MSENKEKNVVAQQEKAVVEEQKVIEKGINFAIKELEQRISKDVAESGIPISVVRLTLENILTNIKNAEAFQVAKEQKEFFDNFNKIRNEGGEA